MFIYVVKPGDTLASLATRFGVDADTLRNFNSLAVTNLTRGQALLIPSDRYLTEEGDTLWEIQQKTGVPWQAIARANGLTARTHLRANRPLRLPPPPRREIEVMGYLPITDPGTSAADLRPLADVLTYVAVFAYIVDQQGKLTAPKEDQAILTESRSMGASPLMSIANIQEGGAFSPEAARAVLTDPNARRAALDNIESTIKSKNYDGLDSDLENLERDLRDDYPAFLQEAKARITPRLVTVAAPPKWNETAFGYARGHDYHALGRVADRIFIMNYEFHWVGGPPGAIAPLNSTRRVLQYATQLIDRNKVLNGIETTAYDWTLPDTPENKAKPMSDGEAITLAQQHQVPIRYSEAQESPWFRYTDDQGHQHEVWFEDARSLMAKLVMVRDLGIRGIGIWSIEYFNPALPALLRHLFTIHKG